ncbi:MAG: hypothetical protein J5772_08460 [Clostridia bacterium]|nr:hypothetical protein [Clostridia bacterium]
MKRAVLITAAVLFAILSCACVTNEQIRSYNAGVAAYESCDFETAKGLFITAGSYANARSYLNSILEHERIYLDALALFDAHDYPAARHSFASIETFGNAAEYIALIDRLEARYNEGLTAYKAKDYVLAKERFVQAQGYADSASYVQNIGRLEDSYEIAMSFYREGNLLEALAAFERIGTSYRDTDERIAEIKAIFASRGLTARQFLSLYLTSNAEAGENVSVMTSEIRTTAFAITTSDELLMTGDTDEDGYIRSVSFWLSLAKIKDIGTRASNRIFAHCIHALDIDGMDFAEVYSAFNAFTQDGEPYGMFTFTIRDDGDHRVLTATRITDNE